MTHEESIPLLLDDKLAMALTKPCFSGKPVGHRDVEIEGNGSAEPSQTSMVLPIESEIELRPLDTHCAGDDSKHSLSDGTPDLETQPSSRETSCYSSLRVKKRKQRMRMCDNSVDVDIECSKDHWSELTAGSTEDESNREIFERLKKDPEFAELFRLDFSHLKLGEKFAEGGQAEIFEAIDLPGTKNKTKYAIKVFKRGISLAGLQRQWPLGMLQYSSAGFRAAGALRIEGGLVLDDDRFGFVVPRYWGDLRKLMDMRMTLGYGCSRRNMGPFVEADVINILHRIALGMKGLHAHGIVHRDLKAANVLVFLNEDVFFTSGTLSIDKFSAVVSVADYECSWGVLGTGFWRAPEVLQVLKKNGPGHCNPFFTKEADVYSFGMVCYEIVTGLLPFEGHPASDYDIVLRGNRPWFSPDSPRWAADLIRQCWQRDPSKRPTFDTLEAQLKQFKTSHTPRHATDTTSKRKSVHSATKGDKLLFFLFLFLICIILGVSQFRDILQKTQMSDNPPIWIAIFFVMLVVTLLFMVVILCFIFVFLPMKLTGSL